MWRILYSNNLYTFHTFYNSISQEYRILYNVPKTRTFFRSNWTCSTWNERNETHHEVLDRWNRFKWHFLWTGSVPREFSWKPSLVYFTSSISTRSIYPYTALFARYNFIYVPPPSVHKPLVVRQRFACELERYVGIPRPYTSFRMPTNMISLNWVLGFKQIQITTK